MDLTTEVFNSVLARVRNGSGLRDALESEGHQLNAETQKWFLDDPSRERAYLAAKNKTDGIS